jgi:hypothetical protein
MRSRDAVELILANPRAFILAFIIAYRAEYGGGFNRNSLKLGESLLGDHDDYGMSEQQYRTAKDQLAERAYATFEPTNKWTVGRLLDTRLFAIFRLEGNDQNNTRPTVDQRSANGRVTTTESSRPKEREEQKGRKSPHDLEDWQLEKDVNRLRKMISEQGNAATPNQVLLAKNQMQLTALSNEAAKRGLSERNGGWRSTVNPRNVGVCAGITDYAAAAARRSEPPRATDNDIVCAQDDLPMAPAEPEVQIPRAELSKRFSLILQSIDDPTAYATQLNPH